MEIWGEWGRFQVERNRVFEQVDQITTAQKAPWVWWLRIYSGTIFSEV